MIVIKSLQFQNIGRFVESQTIDFTQLGSLVQVDGQNNNTGGSSGSGKSTIFKALEFLLGLNDISNSVLQSRLTKEPISVTGLFELDGIPLKIERGKKLLIDLNGEITTGSSKLSEEKLDELIGMPRDLFRKILHKRQGEGGFFLEMGPSDVHKFLTNCLGLDKEQTKIVTLDARLATLLETEVSFKSILEANKMALEATLSAISSLGTPPILEIDPGVVEELKTKHLGAIDNHKLVKDSHKKEMEDLEKNRPQIVITPFDRTRIEQLENEIGTILSQITILEDNEKQRCLSAKSKISELQIKINNSKNEEQVRQSLAQSKLNNNKLETTKAQYTVNEGNRAKLEAIKLAKELEKIRASICPTCEQGWITDKAKEEEASIVQKLQGHKKTVIVGMEADKKISLLKQEKELLDLECLPKVLSEIKDYELLIGRYELENSPRTIPEVIELKLKNDFKNKELNTIRQEERLYQAKENTIMQDILAIYAQKQTALRQTHQEMIQFLQSEENKTLVEYENAKNKVRSFEDAKSRFEEGNARLVKQSIHYLNQVDTATSELTSVQEEIELATESKKAIKSYLSCSFEDALDSIGDMATRLIRGIPNMSTATIQFEGLKETKEGKIKEEVTCLISMDGEIGIPVKSLSGGERSSVDIGIDLAVIKFIEERTGKGINLFILDEAFNGLDSTCIEEAIEMLKNCSIDKRLFIVEHNPVVSQSIENRLTVVRDGLTSKIVHQ